MMIGVFSVTSSERYLGSITIFRRWARIPRVKGLYRSIPILPWMGFVSLKILGICRLKLRPENSVLDVSARSFWFLVGWFTKNPPGGVAGVLLMVQTTWDIKKDVVNNGITNQPQLVSLQDFWTINSMKKSSPLEWWRNHHVKNL